MSMFRCGGCDELKDCDFVGCTEGPNLELWCDDCVTEHTEIFDEEGELIERAKA